MQRFETESPAADPNRPLQETFSDRAQVVMRVRQLVTELDRSDVLNALEEIEGVACASADCSNGIVRVEGNVSDAELIRAMQSLGKSCVIITHTRGMSSVRAGSASGAKVKAGLLLKLLRRQLECCAR